QSNGRHASIQPRSPYRTRLTGWLIRLGARRENSAGPHQFLQVMLPAAAQTGEIAARKRLRSGRALRAELPVGIDDGLAVTAGPGQPLSGETLADLMQACLQGPAR